MVYTIATMAIDGKSASARTGRAADSQRGGLVIGGAVATSSGRGVGVGGTGVTVGAAVGTGVGTAVNNGSGAVSGKPSERELYQTR